MGALSAVRSRRHIRAIVFDFDGTLVDSVHVKRLAYDAAFARFPKAHVYIEKSLARYPDRDRRFIIDVIVRHLRRAGEVSSDDAPKVIAGATRRYADFCRKGVAAAADFRGVEDTLSVLARRRVIAINSGTPQRQLRHLIRNRSWGRWCQLVYGAPASKESNLQRIAAELGLRPDQMVMVGDSDVDERASKKIGCAFIRVMHGSDDTRSRSGISCLPDLLTSRSGFDTPRAPHV
jgi:phosphoglycolate phosphatase-like HAD superfamily hydrolase